MKRLEAYTDGGSDNNPGESGWAFYVKGKVQAYGYGGPNSTNSRMELTAMLNCLKWIGKDRRAIIYCDSTYVVKGLSEWIGGWIKRGWKISSGAEVANKDLWQELYENYNPEVHELAYVKGHSGIAGNDLCDRLVQQGKVEKEDYVLVELSDEGITLNANEEPQDNGITKESILQQVNALKDIFNNASEYVKREVAASLARELSLFNYKVGKYE